MASTLLDSFLEAQEAWSEAQARTREAEARAERAEAELVSAQTEEKAAARVMREAKRKLEEALPDSPREAPAPAVARARRGRGFRIQPNHLEVLAAFPLDGALRFSDLEAALEVEGSALRSRIGKLKKMGLLESAGWGQYRLSEEGRKARRPVAVRAG